VIDAVARRPHDERVNAGLGELAEMVPVGRRP